MICLDFDGVLFDTAKEAYIVANKAYFNNTVEQNVLNRYSQFLLLRPFVVSAWQYLLVFDLISEDLDNKALLEKYKQQSVFEPTPRDRDFEYKFNNVRGDMANTSKNKWLDLHEPYTFFRLIRPILIKCPQYFQIVSTKNKKFILELLFNQGIHWEGDRIWGRDKFEECGHSKAEVLKSYADSNASILFIDDSHKHLNEVRLLNNVEVMSADWGYTEINNVEDNTEIVVTRIANYLDGLCRYC